MRGDLEKARAEVIEAATVYIGAASISQDWMIFARLERAVQSLRAIESRSRPSDGGRMTQDSIGGENV